MHFEARGHRPCIRGQTAGAAPSAGVRDPGTRWVTRFTRSRCRFYSGRVCGSGATWTNCRFKAAFLSKGEIRISGAKNATLPILAGCLLADGPVTVVERAAPARRHHDDRAARAHGRLGDHRREDAHRGRCVDDQGILRPLPTRKDDARIDTGAGPAARALRLGRRIPARRLRDRRAPGQYSRRRSASHGRRHPHRERLHQGARASA